MKERPILFQGAMVRALLAGTKSQTRRAMKGLRAEIANANNPGQHAPIAPYTNGKGSWNFVLAATGHGTGDPFPCPYGQPGDRLWVKESWAQRLDLDHLNGTQLYAAGVRDAWYWADGPGKCCNTGCAGAAGRVRAARFMPRWASRILLEITDVRVQRLQEISEADAIAEGTPGGHGAIHGYSYAATPIEHYRWMWDQINGAGAWDANPWVWALAFRRVQS